MARLLNPKGLRLPDFYAEVYTALNSFSGSVDFVVTRGVDNIGSGSHAAGKALDISCAEYPQIYFLFNHLCDLLCSRGYHIALSLHNHHIHIDKYYSSGKFNELKTKEGRYIFVPYDDLKSRNFYNVVKDDKKFSFKISNDFKIILFVLVVTIIIYFFNKKGVLKW